MEVEVSARMGHVAAEEAREAVPAPALVRPSTAEIDADVTALAAYAGL